MMDENDDRLPTVPLLPFQNQVGGHSAIYKFTKRAVCKVCRLLARFCSLSCSYLTYTRLMAASRLA